MAGIKTKPQPSPSAQTRWGFCRRRPKGLARIVVTGEPNVSGWGLSRSFWDWFAAFTSGVKARLRAHQQESTRISRLQEDPQGRLEEIVREIEGVVATLRSQHPEDEMDEVGTQLESRRLVRAVPAVLVRVGRRPPVVNADEEAEILDDTGRLRFPERPTKSVSLRFIQAGRRPPRISEDEG